MNYSNQKYRITAFNLPKKWVHTLLAGALLMMTACDPGATTVPFADKVKKVWTAKTVNENSTLVYTRGAASNVKNYTSFRLDLSAPPAVSLTDLDGSTFTGQYELQGETKLILKNLAPQPTATGGTIEYMISSLTDSELTLIRTTPSVKTGNTTNQYLLTGN